MSDSESNENTVPKITSESDEFARQFATFMRNSFVITNPKIEIPNQPEIVQFKIDTTQLLIGFKLSGENYPLWAVLMKMAISGRGLISDIDGVPAPPAKTEPLFPQWQQADHYVFTWLVQNLEPKLVNRVSQHRATKDIWDSLAITYASGGDAIQAFDLQRKSITLKQGDDSLEDVWNTLQDQLVSIDQKEPNPMESPKDIEVWNRKIQVQSLYQFLIALNDRYESTKKEN